MFPQNKLKAKFIIFFYFSRGYINQNMIATVAIDKQILQFILQMIWVYIVSTGTDANNEKQV